MDADWLNRAGILAEAISFVLIAPEILGAERLRQLEDALERWGLRNVNTSVFMRFPGRLIPFLPGIRGDPRGNLLFETSYFIGSSVLFVLIPRLLAGVFDMFLLQAIFMGTTFVGLLGILVVHLNASRRLARYVGYSLAAIAVPSALVLVAATGTAFLALRAGVRLLMKLLAGEGRLRALVFGTGVLLLFGGMATQFTATF